MKIALYGCETREEAIRLKCLLFLTCELQENEGVPDLGLIRIERDPPLIRVGQNGNPDVEVHWYLTTTNIILAGQKEVVEGAIRLLDRPWWYAISKAWVIFAWNCWTGKRRMKKEYAR